MQSSCVHRLLAVAVAGGMAPAVYGASVTDVSGTIDLVLDPVDFSTNEIDPLPDPPVTAHYDVTFPGSNTREITKIKTGVIDQDTATGVARVSYDLSTSGDTTVFDIDAYLFAPTGSGRGERNFFDFGQTEFELTFTTTETLSFEFVATPTGDGKPTDFLASFNSIVASARVDPLTGEFNGTVPVIEEGGFPVRFDELVQTGVLGAGTYTLYFRLSETELSEGNVRLTLSPHVIPTPAAGLAGIALLAGGLARRRTR